jgi:DNA-directed RNA polymerase I, II, and III subunit RPABC1
MTATLVSRSFRTIIEMLEDREFDMSSVDKNAMFETIAPDFNQTAFRVLLPHRIHVVYHTANKFKYSEVKKYMEDAVAEAAQFVILVVNDTVTSTYLKQLDSHKVPREIHHIKMLQINISKHELVPKHEVVRDQEDVKQILEQYSLKSKHHLPIILKSDPMAKYLGLKSGDIVKITRASPTAGEYILYRVCV